MKSSGLLLGLGLLLFTGLISYYSLYLLSKCIIITKTNNYQDLSYFTLGRIGRLITTFSLIFLTFGTLCAYFMILGNKLFYINYLIIIFLIIYLYKLLKNKEIL
jgi:amino acid permease